MELQEHRNQMKRVLITRPSNKSLQSMKASIKETILVRGKAKSLDELIHELPEFSNKVNRS